MLGMIDEGFEQVEQRAVLRDVIAQLPEAEREILLLRFVANKTQTEIAALVGVSQMQVSRLVARGLKKLRASLGAPEPIRPRNQRVERCGRVPRAPAG